MPSHFTAIGFPVRNMDEYWALAKRAAAEGVRNTAPDGSALVRWAADSGPEIWSHVDRAGEVLGAIPFFSTGTSYRIAVTATGEDPDEEMEGWIEGWLEPSEEAEPYSGLFPLRADVVNYALTRNRLTSFPSLHRMELIAIAHEADLYPDDQTYRNTPGETYRVPLGAFVSSAHFAADEDVATFSESAALLSGRITAARPLSNPVTSAPYWWIQAAVQGATINAFIDRETLGSEPSGGEILAGSFWLLGRLL